MEFNYNIPQFNINLPKVQFKSASGVYAPYSTPSKDTFTSNPLYENFGTKAQIEAEIKSNPRIKELLNQYNIQPKVNIEELNKLKQGHLQDTRVTAAKIYSALPQELKREANLPDIQQAALFHDYGKVLIPDSILNKAGQLTEKEREIMNLHSELGYELLKDKNLSENALGLVKYHHQTPHGTGYPAINDGFVYGIDTQILNAADKYSALREKRSYKEPLSREEALEVMREDVNKGIISQEVYNALERAV